MGDVEWAFEDSKRYPFSVDYNVGRDLGEGKFSVVKYATHKRTGEEVAIKCIDRVNTNPDELVHEAMLVQLVEEHPGIIKIKDVYEDTKNYYLVMEFVSGGELFDKIVESDNYSEKEAAAVINQICNIVAYVHDKGVVHRDLKPENLLCKDKTGTDLKLCDFGLGDTIEDDELLTAIVGSTTYMAPEVDKGVGYDKSVDMYSIGVILYILLCGYPPFEPDSGIVDLEFPAKEWSQVSPVAIQIIKRLLSVVPSERLTARELLRHPWVKGESVSTRKLVGTIKNVKMFNTARKTGQTVRTKDPVTKATVFNVFEEPSPKEETNHSNGTTTTTTTTNALTTNSTTNNNDTAPTTTTTSTTSPTKTEDQDKKGKAKKDKSKDKKDKGNKSKSKSPKKSSKDLTLLAKKDTPKVGFSDSTPTKVGFVETKSNSKVGFADDVDYKKKYEELSTELNDIKINHEKEVSELKDQIKRLEKEGGAKKSGSPKKTKHAKK